MASGIIEQLKTTADDSKRQELWKALSTILLAAPLQAQEDVLSLAEVQHLCSLQSDETASTSIRLLQLLADLCRRNDLYSTEAIKVIISKIESIDNVTTKEAILAACICFPSALDYVRKNPHEPNSRALWDEITELKNIIVREVDSSYLSIKLVALRFVQVVIVSYSMPNFAPPFLNMSKSAEQLQRLAPSFQLNRVPVGHPILIPEEMARTALELWQAQFRDQLLGFVDGSGINSSGRVSIISSLMNLCSNILQTRTQFVGPIVTLLADFYQDYSDPPTRFERKSLAHIIQSTMDAIIKYDLGTATSLLSQCRSGHIARGRRKRELEMRRAPHMAFGHPHAQLYGHGPMSTDPRLQGSSASAQKGTFAAPPTTLGSTQTSEALSRIVAGLMGRLAKPNSNLYSGFALASRIATELPLEDEALERFYELIEASCHMAPGKGLVLMWINSEYNSYLIKKARGTPSDSAMDVDAGAETKPSTNLLASQRYNRVISIALDKMSNSEFLGSLILDIPELTDQVFAFLDEKVHTSRSPDLFLTALRNISATRPPYRLKALGQLLEFTKDENDLLQSKLIGHLKELMAHESLTNLIIDFSKDQLAQLLDNPDVVRREEELKLASELRQQTEAQGMPVEVQNQSRVIPDHPLTPIQVNTIVKRYLNLYLGLYAERPELLLGAVDVYSKIHAEELRAGISRSIMFRVKTVGVDHPVVIQVVVDHPPNTDKLALELCDANGPTPAMARAVMDGFLLDKVDSRFVASVFPGLTKEEAISVLPRLLPLPQATQRRIVSLTLNRPPGFPLSPEELLIQLHVLRGPNGTDMIKECVAWVGMMFDDPSKGLLKTDVLYPALVQLVQTSPLPLLFFRTLILSSTHLKAMEPYVLSLLSRAELMDAKVWSDQRHRLGFVNTCEKLLPHSASLILNLPLDKFEAVITLKPTIKEALKQRMLVGQAIPFDKQAFFADAALADSSAAQTAGGDSTL